MSVTNVSGACVLTFVGVLDATTFSTTRDAIVKAVLDEPRIAVVDVTGLDVRDDPAWAAFTSARWQTTDWPDVPIGLVSANEIDRNTLRRNGITRYVPVYATLASALAEMTAEKLRRYRRCGRASIAAQRSSIHRCRELTAQWLAEWSRPDFVHITSLVATELVEATLTDTNTDFVLRVETDGSTVAVAVQHVGIANSARRKSAHDNVSGLDLVAAHSRAWGVYTTLSGNTIWCVVGPENRF